MLMRPTVAVCVLTLLLACVHNAGADLLRGRVPEEPAVHHRCVHDGEGHHSYRFSPQHYPPQSDRADRRLQDGYAPIRIAVHYLEDHMTGLTSAQET